jgi:DNA-binding CsgD family transcriptional regulator
MPNNQSIKSLIMQCPLSTIVSLTEEEGIDLLSMYRTPAADIHQGTVGHAGHAGTVGHADTAKEADRPVPGTAQKGSGMFSRKVRQVARTYLLTERETDILFELAKGHGPAFIQEKYYLSEGTIKTHLRNIYRKTNVHKRAALMNLI